jgi:hypothetical protein
MHPQTQTEQFFIIYGDDNNNHDIPNLEFIKFFVDTHDGPISNIKFLWIVSLK